MIRKLVKRITLASLFIILISFAMVPAQASSYDGTEISCDQVEIYVQNAVTFTVKIPPPPDYWLYVGQHNTWDFGDGTVIDCEVWSPSIQHTYEKPGTYLARCWGTYLRYVRVFKNQNLWGSYLRLYDTVSFDYSISITVINEPPVADAGGPYIGYEGSPITLNGTRSYDPDGKIIKYAWDLDGDGVFDDALGPTPSYTWGDDYHGNIGLKVTDNAGATATDIVILTGSNIQITNNGGVGAKDADSTEVTILNVAPTVTIKSVERLTPSIMSPDLVFTGSNIEVYAGDMISFRGDAYDLGSDDLTFKWNWEDGTADTVTIYLNNGTYPSKAIDTSTHIYYQKGTYMVTLTVTDDDGGVGTDTVTVTVKPIPDPLNIDPNTLNLKSKGKWITAYIELPEGYDVNKIDVPSIMLNGTVPVLTKPFEISDHDGNGIPDLMVKFDRQTIVEYLTKQGITKGEVTFTVTGKVFYNGGWADLEGNDFISVK